MEMSLLEDFLAVSRLGGFGRAAEQRNITQPAFSRRIKALENWVGSPLFDRSTHRVALTDAGKVLYPIAEGVVRVLHQVRYEVRGISGATTPVLNFVSVHTLACTFFPAWIKKIKRTVPEGSIKLTPFASADCEDLMQQGKYALYLSYYHSAAPGPLSESAFERICVGRERLLPVSAPVKGQTPKFELPGRSDAPVSYLGYGPKSGIQRIVSAVHRDNARPLWLREVCSMTSGILLKPLVLAGWGMTWLLESLVRTELRAGTLVAAGAREWSIDIEVCVYRPRGDHRQSTDLFWDKIKAAAPANAQANPHGSQDLFHK